jgi:hypothetical protein
MLIDLYVTTHPSRIVLVDGPTICSNASQLWVQLLDRIRAVPNPLVSSLLVTLFEDTIQRPLWSSFNHLRPNLTTS